MPNIPVIIGTDTSGQAALLGLGKLLPFVTGVRSLFFPGTSAELTRMNARRGGAPATIVGNPVYKNGYATFKSLSDYLRTTDMDDSPHLTMMILMRATPGYAADGQNATKIVGMGNFRTKGSMIWTQSNPSYDALSFAGSTNYDNNGSSVIAHTYVKAGPIDITQWALYAFIRQAGLNRRSYDMSRNTSQIVADDRTPDRNIVDPFLIGGAFANYAGYVDVHSAFNAAIPCNDDQRGAMGQFMKDNALRRGIAA